LKNVSKNFPWLIIFIACVFWLIHNMIRNGMVAYYFDYVNGEGSKVLWTFSIGVFNLDFNQTTTFLTIVTFGMIAGVLLCTPLKKYFDRKRVIIFLTLGLTAANAVFYWLPQDHFIMLCTFNAFWAIFAGALPVFLFAMFADVADYHEWKFGQRATGLVTAGIMFAIKLGVAIGGFLGLFILGHYGYAKNVPVTPETISGIKLLFSLIPAGFILICGVILYFYPLNEEMLATIETDLKARKEAEKN
ncbi:MAG: MFS transporter, partial [Bacteroidales bacterium]